ncbi:hypothetical protein AXFE_27420 [Acidithrix ferrooxidans]|uniref:Uncharacterized protein n=1 Tax=Acidithrix ferrooxidans TaxID=1280514 RepID=A0A0D8HEQ5_9ACTN|nr:hypothetical protein AXFE_27420 [Acidithrix ferrooxidans]
MQHLELHFFNVNLVDVKLALPPGLSFIEVISLYPSGSPLSIYCPTTSVVFRLLPLLNSFKYLIRLAG